MRSPVRPVLVALAILMVAVIPSFAEDEAPDHQLILVHEAHINLDRTADQEAMIKDFVPIAAQHKHPFPFSTFSLEEGGFFFVTPLEGYAGLAEFNAAWKDTMAKMGEEKMAEFMARGEGVDQYGLDSLWWHRSDLSYVPEDLEDDPAKSTFRFWGWFYGKPGHEKQIEDAFKAFIALSEKQNVRRAWQTYVGDVGTEMPVYVWAEMGASEAAFATMSEEIMKKEGDESATLWNEMLQHARKVEFMRGQYRPELSYKPPAAE